MNIPIIAVDLDDVLADATEFWRVEVNRRTGLDLKTEHYRVPGDYWGYYEHVWKTHKVDHLISIPKLDDQIVSDQSGIRAYADSLTTLERLADRHKLVVVTARNGDQRPESEKWLSQNFPDIFDTIIFADGPRGIATKNKGDICKEIGAQWLIDDSTKHCQDALDKGVQAVLFGEYGWHRDVPPRAVLCKDWVQVLEYFDGQG